MHGGPLLEEPVHFHDGLRGDDVDEMMDEVMEQVEETVEDDDVAAADGVVDDVVVDDVVVDDVAGDVECVTVVVDVAGVGC